MSMVFKFRMLSDENDNFLRDFEVFYDMNLFQFHEFICDVLDFDPTAMASFFLSNSNWEKLQEFTLFDMGTSEEGSPIAMENATLGQIIHNNKDRLIYVFDMFADRAFFLELTAAFEAEKGSSYPAMTMQEGEAPDQFDPTVVKDSGNIFEDALGEFGSFEGDDFYDDEY